MWWLRIPGGTQRRHRANLGLFPEDFLEEAIPVQTLRRGLSLENMQAEEGAGMDTLGCVRMDAK